MKILSLKGTVFSGKGEGESFVGLPWLRKQVRRKLGFTPYAGTLNVKLGTDTVKKRRILEKTKSVLICPPEGFCSGRLIKGCSINKMNCGLVIPEVAGYPKDVIEVIAATNLRRLLKLEDGDVVEIRIMLS